MLQIRLFMLSALAALVGSVRPAANIILYLQPAPHQVTSSLGPLQAQQEIETLLSQQPSHLSAALLEGALSGHVLPTVGGFLAVYNGYGDFANTDGLLSFPLRHLPATKLYVLLTPEIDLVRAEGNTIAYAQIPQSARGIAERYEFTKSKDLNDKPFWQVQRSDLPASGRITGRTLSIVTHPRNIFVEQGSFASHPSGHMLLPRNMYVVGTRQQTRLLLSSLDLLRFHEPIEYARAVASELVHKSVMINQ